MSEPYELLLGGTASEHPTQLWAVGDSTLLSERMVAIVGSRSATMYGEQVAYDMAADLARDHVIVSGGAFGIDIAAHRGASVARTIVVLPCGLDRTYPVAHASMFDRIVANGGLLLSEQPPGAAPTREKFLARNRIIAGLAEGTVVVEAALQSGAISTANWTRQLGKPLMAVPGPVTSSTSAGTNHLIRDGAHLVMTADDVRKVLNT